MSTQRKRKRRASPPPVFTENLMVRCTPAQKRALAEAAQSQQQTAAAFVRAFIDGLTQAA